MATIYAGHIQVLILDTTGLIPTVPAIPTDTPNDAGWVVATDILIGEMAFNKVDNKLFTRGVSGIIEVGTTASNSQLSGIVAFPTGGQAGATVLTHTFNVIDTCASANDSCKTDAAVIGNVREVINHGAQDLELFPAAGEEFYDGFSGLALGINVPFVIAPGNGIKLRCFVTGKYRF